MKNDVLYDQEVTEIYDDWVGSGYYNYQQVAETLSKIIGKRKKVLELGIGTGNAAILLAQKGYQVTGIDPSPFMLAKLEEKLKKIDWESRGFSSKQKSCRLKVNSTRFFPMVRHFG